MVALKVDSVVVLIALHDVLVFKFFRAVGALCKRMLSFVLVKIMKTEWPSIGKIAAHSAIGIINFEKPFLNFIGDTMN